jgi:hypothetical protein
VIHFNGLIQNYVVARKQFGHFFGIFLRKLGATLNIREEKSDCTGWELYRVSHLNNSL